MSTSKKVFWADEIADEILARNPDEPIVIKGAFSPSGTPHIGHLNEILRGYFVAMVLREQGYEAHQIFTFDDRDALRNVPELLTNADGQVVTADEDKKVMLQSNLGVPYSDIPDPFGSCHDSYADHFADQLKQVAGLLDIPIDFYFISDIYDSGKLESISEDILGQVQLSRSILQEHEDRDDDDYVPFMPQCSNCSQLTQNVTAVDMGQSSIKYRCTGLVAGNRTIGGCGHRGVAHFRDGKLPWLFEWPAGWKLFGVDFEPFGQDHSEGSWPVGKDVARKILEIAPPVPLIYEWITLNGEPLSSSTGNVISVSEFLELVEPEVLLYFYSKNPRKQRDLNIDSLNRLVDEFDRFESAYFGEITPKDDQHELINRVYPLIVDRICESRVRIPYTSAAILGMFDDQDLIISMARRQGLISEDTSQWAINNILDRIDYAHRWAQRVDNKYNYQLQSEPPELEISSEIEAVLDDIAESITESHNGEEIQNQIFESAERYDTEPTAVFETIYQLFLNEEKGPRIGPLLADLDFQFVVQRLRRE